MNIILQKPQPFQLRLTTLIRTIQTLFISAIYQDKNGHEIVDAGTFCGLMATVNSPNPATTFYIDFVYRIDLTNDYPSHPADPIYNLQLHLQTTGGAPVIQYSA